MEQFPAGTRKRLETERDSEPGYEIGEIQKGDRYYSLGVVPVSSLKENYFAASKA